MNSELQHLVGMYSISRIQAIRAWHDPSYDEGKADRLTLTVADLNGGIMTIFLALEMGEAGKEIAAGIAKLVSEHRGNGSRQFEAFEDKQRHRAAQNS